MLPSLSLPDLLWHPPIQAEKSRPDRDQIPGVGPALATALVPRDPHDLRFMQPRALGRKWSDEFVVLSAASTTERFGAGDERAWWNINGIDPIKAARKLRKATRSTWWRLAQCLLKLSSAPSIKSKKPLQPLSEDSSPLSVSFPVPC